MRKLISWTFILSLMTFTPLVRGENIDQSYSLALNHFYKGDFRKAAEGLSALIAIPIEDPSLHYNLGCTYFKLGEFGRATFHFEKTLQISPDAEDATFNLEKTKSLISQKFPDEKKGPENFPLVFTLGKRVNLTLFGILLLLCTWGGAILIYIVRKIPLGPLRVGLLTTFIFLSILGTTLATGVGLSLYAQHKYKLAISLPLTSELHEGPNVNTRAIWKIQPGSQLLLKSELEERMLVQLGNGLQGWVPSRNLGKL